MNEERPNEGQKLASLAEEPAPRLPRRAPQGSCLRDQQDTAPLQGPSGLSKPKLSGKSRVRKLARLFLFARQYNLKKNAKSECASAQGFRHFVPGASGGDIFGKKRFWLLLFTNIQKTPVGKIEWADAFY